MIFIMRASAGRILPAVFAFAGLFLYAGCAFLSRPEQPIVNVPEPVETDSRPGISESATPAEEIEAPEIEPEFFHHTVSWPGETLTRISAWYTNSSSNWNLILEANPGLQPTRMQLGTVINIPVDLVKNTTPMPKSFLKTALKTQNPSDNPDTSQQKIEEMELFSPDEISPEAGAVDGLELFEPPG